MNWVANESKPLGESTKCFPTWQGLFLEGPRQSETATASGVLTHGKWVSDPNFLEETTDASLIITLLPWLGGWKCGGQLVPPVCMEWRFECAFSGARQKCHWTSVLSHSSCWKALPSVGTWGLSQSWCCAPAVALSPRLCQLIWACWLISLTIWTMKGQLPRGGKLKVNVFVTA